MSNSGWVSAEEQRVYDKHWNLIIDAVSYNPETGEVRRKANVLDGCGDSSTCEVAITRHLTPIHVVPKV